MPGPSTISRVLDHLAWLHDQLGADVNTGNAYAGALLTYNAAAALQWHFVLPGAESDYVADKAARGKAARLIDDFVWRARELFAKAKRVSKKALAGKPGKTLLGDLRAAIATVLRRLPKLMDLPKPVPESWHDLLKSLDPMAMLRDWLTARGLPVKATNAAMKKMGLTGPRSGLRSALAAASVVTDDSVYGARGKEYRKGSAEVVSAMLGHALKDYVATLGKTSGKRTKAIVQDIIRDIDARQAP
jgi:hypothetical protein